MGAGRIRWDSLLPKQLLHSTVFEEVALSVRITLEAGREKKKRGKKKLFARSQIVQRRGQELCQCRFKEQTKEQNLSTRRENKVE